MWKKKRLAEDLDLAGARAVAVPRAMPRSGSALRHDARPERVAAGPVGERPDRLQALREVRDPRRSSPARSTTPSPVERRRPMRRHTTISEDGEQRRARVGEHHRDQQCEASTRLRRPSGLEASQGEAAEHGQEVAGHVGIGHQAGEPALVVACRSPRSRRPRRPAGRSRVPAPSRVPEAALGGEDRDGDVEDQVQEPPVRREVVELRRTGPSRPSRAGSSTHQPDRQRAARRRAASARPRKIAAPWRARGAAGRRPGAAAIGSMANSTKSNAERRPRGSGCGAELVDARGTPPSCRRRSPDRPRVDIGHRCGHVGDGRPARGDLGPGVELLTLLEEEVGHGAVVGRVDQAALGQDLRGARPRARRRRRGRRRAASSRA